MRTLPSVVFGYRKERNGAVSRYPKAIFLVKKLTPSPNATAAITIQVIDYEKREVVGEFFFDSTVSISRLINLLHDGIKFLVRETEGELADGGVLRWKLEKTE